MADLLAKVDRYERGWIVLDRRIYVAPGDNICLGFMGRPICGAVVTEVGSNRIRTDFNLFFAVQGDDILRDPGDVPPLERAR